MHFGNTYIFLSNYSFVPFSPTSAPRTLELRPNVNANGNAGLDPNEAGIPNCKRATTQLTVTLVLIAPRPSREKNFGVIGDCLPHHDTAYCIASANDFRVLNGVSSHAHEYAVRPG
jgi:hypothetical protein